MNENTPLSEKITAKRAGRLQTCPESSKLLLTRCWSHKASPRQVLKAFCQECVGFERQAITDCTAYACPIWEYRPYQKI